MRSPVHSQHVPDTNIPVIRALVADDHFIVRNGLAAIIGAEPGMQVIAQAADGEQAVELYEQHRPDVVLMDLRMPVKTGAEAIAQIRRAHPGAHILVVTASTGDADIRRALALGVHGYVFKNTSGESLIRAIRAAAAGERWIPPDVAESLARQAGSGTLTARETEVLREIAKGLANKEIATRLAISEYTVKDHLKNILNKLHAAARTEAVTTAVQRGIIEL